MIIRVPKKCEAHMKSVEVIFYTLLNVSSISTVLHFSADKRQLFCESATGIL